MPEVCVKVTIINFTVTLRGLEDQLLVDVVRFERPDLEAKKDALIVSIAGDQRQLKEIEDRILQMLADAKGEILDDENLINSLAASKSTSRAIGERMRDAEVTTKEISEAREHYRPVATRGSILYFVIADLAQIDSMYQFSLQAFSRLYNMRIEKSERADNLLARVRILIDDITRSFYTNVCRGLFEVHKLLYSFSIAVQVARGAGSISPAEWSYFLLGAASVPAGISPAPLPESCREWIAPKAWSALQALDTLPGFHGLVADVTGISRTGWKTWSSSADPASTPLPGRWGHRKSAPGDDVVVHASPEDAAASDSGLTIFQRLLVVRAMRDEKTVQGVREFVRAQLGDSYTTPPPFDLEGAYNDSTSQTPIVFVLSPGADPIDYLLKLAKSKGKAGPGLRMISLGQGQGPIAERMMEGARRTGDWVVLQNCHLAVSWLPRMETLLEAAGSTTGEHPEYRLWLTSMPSASFPVPVLQNSIKLTNEPPRGLRANLMRTFLDVTVKDYDSCSKGREFKKLLFGLAFYHALILERRKFGAIGWNIPYDWMNSDLKTGTMQLRMYLEEQPVVPFETLNAVVGDIT
jgi:dynein heavy chain